MARAFTLILAALVALASGCKEDGPVFDHDDPSKRRKAIVMLAAEDAPAHAGTLLRMAEADPDPDVRLAAMRTLGVAGDPAALPVLRAALVDTGSGPMLREAALQSLVSLGGEAAGRVVVGAYLELADGDPLIEPLRLALVRHHPIWYALLAADASKDPGRAQAVLDSAPAWIRKPKQ